MVPAAVPQHLVAPGQYPNGLPRGGSYAVPQQPQSSNTLWWVLGGIALFVVLSFVGCTACVFLSAASASGAATMQGATQGAASAHSAEVHKKADLIPQHDGTEEDSDENEKPTPPAK
jgi:hypothetical protein